MKIVDISKVDVFYHRKYVGTLTQSTPFEVSFVYSKEWLENGFSISPFKLPLERKVFVCNDFLTQSMFGVFLDCLPNTWGNYLVDKFLLTEGIDPKKVTILQRLTLLDDNSLGALEFKPSKQLKFEENDIESFDVLQNKIHSLLNNGNKNDGCFWDIFHRGSSAGGSRPKINYSIDNDLYIVKFPSKFDSNGIGKEEFALNELAAKCGINVPDRKLLPSKISNGYFASKRFDRINGSKIHVILLAGLFDLNPGLSQIHYKGFLQTVKALCPEDIYQAVKIMIFNYLIGNKDDHPRNFSFIYNEKEHKYRLSPFYDITSTPNIENHMMQVNSKDNPTIEDFVIDCEAVGVKRKTVVKIYESLTRIIDKK